VSVIILAAGAGSRIKSNEPRSLLKIGSHNLIEHQISVINNTFNNPEIIGVFGVSFDKIIKKLNGKLRIVENQLHETTNNAESLRLAINNSMMDNILFFHGDLYFEQQMFDNISFTKSFLLIDNGDHFNEYEVGVTTESKKVSILSYGLNDKWCQIAFLTGRELKIARNLFAKFSEDDKKLLSFEVINKIIDLGGSFDFHINKTPIIEIDCIKDLQNENFNI
jgi:choline kinase